MFKLIPPVDEVLDRLLGEVESLRKRIEAVEWEHYGDSALAAERSQQAAQAS